MKTWLHDEIQMGLLALHCLGLERTPPKESEAMEVIVNAWAMGLLENRVWDAERDIPRIRRAFAKLLTACRAWPCPRDFLEALPPDDQPALPHRVALSEEARKAAERAMQQAVEELARHTAIPGVPNAQPKASGSAEIEASLKRHYADRKTQATGGE